MGTGQYVAGKQYSGETHELYDQACPISADPGCRGEPGADSRLLRESLARAPVVAPSDAADRLEAVGPTCP